MSGVAVDDGAQTVDMAEYRRLAAENEQMAAGNEQLRNEVTSLQAQNQELVAQAVKLEDEFANRMLTECDAVITDATREFWREQLVTNREKATVALQDLLRGKAGAVGGAGGAGAARAPMHNRSAARPVVPAAAGGDVAGAAGAGGEDKAVKIRNRAHEICKAERVPFVAAFKRAEMEVGG